MNRPKKEFIPTSLSDLNIDTLSIGSNSDRHNNNSNGARLNNFDRFKATSSSNLSYKHSNFNNNNNHASKSNHNGSNNIGSSRTSKLYSSQSNLSTTSSTGSRYQPVVHNNNYNINSPKSAATGDMDKWLQAWEDTNNNYRAPSFHPNAPRQQPQHSKVLNRNSSSSSYEHSNSNNNFNSNKQSVVVDPFDPFEDPWSGTLLLFPIIFSFSVSHFLLSLLICTKVILHFAHHMCVFIFRHIYLFHIFSPKQHNLSRGQNFSSYTH
jgi:hypothetical protein